LVAPAHVTNFKVIAQGCPARPNLVNQTPEQLEATIAALEGQRAVLGAVVVDTALSPLRRELAALRAAESPAAGQQLKQVSVLFVDVVGSTAIGQQLGPEEIHAVMDSALERFTAVVQAHHGRVLQYTGDGMLAAFGSEQASEDDAEEAIRAGLGIINAARAHAPQVQREYGVPDFNVRIGIHTGRVLLGGGVDAEGSIRGATVNVAARMEQSAPAGGLRISHDTWQHVRGLFDVVEQAPISVKGVTQPLTSYLVERARPRALRAPTRGIDGLATPMVGRAAELEALFSALDSVRAARAVRAVTVVGEAGLGKSRLLAEFLHGLEPPPGAAVSLDAVSDLPAGGRDRSCWLLLCRAHPRSALHPFGQLRDLLAGQLQIAEDDDALVARYKLEQGLAPFFVDEGLAPVHALGHLIGLDFSDSALVQDLVNDGPALRERAFAAAALVLHRMAASRDCPVVLVVDDLHWADAGSVDFVRYLLQQHQDLPLLGVFLTRPNLFERLPDWGSGVPGHQRLRLGPLAPADSQHLAELLLQRIEQVPEALRLLLTGRAEGNPFYMEELVRMLHDGGVIVAEGEAWRVLTDKLRATEVPATLAGVLQARLDGLPAAERLALQQAAVVGHVFWDRALAAIDERAVQQLPTLLRRQLVLRRDPAGDGGSLDGAADAAPGADTERRDRGIYIFQHQLLQQVAYDSVLKEPLRQCHQRVGGFWTARAEVAGPQQVTPATCRALAEAHDHRRRADPIAFADWFEGQFSHYLRAYAGQTLEPLAQSVVALCERHHGPDHVETARALTNQARASLQQGRLRTGAEPLLRRALAIQEQALGDDHPDTARTMAVLGGIFQARGDLRGAELWFRRSLDVRERVLGPDHVLTLSTLDNLIYVVNELGLLDEAEALSRRVLQVRERTLGTDDPNTATALTALAEVLTKKGDPAGAEPLLRRALAVQQGSLAAGHPDIGLSLWHLAETLGAQALLDEAEPLAREALRLWEAAFDADHEWIAWGVGSLAGLRLGQGDATEAAALAERALAIHERNFGPQHAQVAAMAVTLARARLALGDAGRAEPLLERALAIQSAPGGASEAGRDATALLLATARSRLANS